MQSPAALIQPSFAQAPGAGRPTSTSGFSGAPDIISRLRQLRLYVIEDYFYTLPICFRIADWSAFTNYVSFPFTALLARGQIRHLQLIAIEAVIN
jgi:hypothetical protein